MISHVLLLLGLSFQTCSQLLVKNFRDCITVQLSRFCLPTSRQLYYISTACHFLSTSFLNFLFCRLTWQLCYITTPFSNLQALISNFSKNFFVAAALSLTTVGGYGILYPAFGIETGRFHTRRDGWVVESTGLENRRCESIRGFESHSLRQFI